MTENKNEKARMRVVVTGAVQGVFFRWNARLRAQQLGVYGFVRNLLDGESVEIVAEGEKPTASSGMVDWHVIAKSDVQWIEKGPLRATIRTRHRWPLLKFEIHVTLYAHSPQVEVVTRLLPEIPPPPDKFEEHGGFPVRIKEGYWLTFAPGFEPGTVVRDFPLGMLLLVLYILSRSSVHLA